MRTMIGKRIGPVPIALVAVLALAAFISAGLWLVPNNGQNAEAQGFADKVQDPKHVCSPLTNTTTGENVPVAEQCIAFGDSATVRLANATNADARYAVFTDGVITGGTNLPLHPPGTTFTGTATDNDTIDANTAEEQASTPLSFKEVTVSRQSSSGMAGREDLIISSNGKNPVSVYLYVVTADPTAPGINTAASDVDDRDYALADPATGLSDTIFFVMTELGKPAKSKSTLMVPMHDPNEGESGPITATFMDYEVVTTATSYKNVGTATAVGSEAGEVAFGNVQVGADALEVVARSNADYQRLRAALIPGMYVTLSNVATPSTHTGTTAAGDRTTAPGSATTTSHTAKITGFGTTTVTTNAIAVTLDAAASTVATSLGATYVADDGTVTASTQSNVMITVHVSRLLDDGMVTFTVEGDGATLDAGLASGISLTATAKQAMSEGTGIKVVGLPENRTDPFRVIVKAEYSGSTGSLTLEDDSLNRTGSLDSVGAMACGAKASNKAEDDGCGEGYEPVNRYSPPDDDDETDDDAIKLRLNSSDALGTKLTVDEYTVAGATALQWWESLDCPQMNDAVAGYIEDGDPAVGSDDPMADPHSPYCAHYPGSGAARILEDDALAVVDRTFASYGDASDAFALGTVDSDNLTTGDDFDTATVMFNDDTDAEDLAGKYLLIVAAEKDGTMKHSNLVRVIISGEAENYAIMAKGGDAAITEDTIGLNGSRTYVLQVTDANGNVPSDMPMVKIVLAGQEGFNTAGLLAVKANNDGITTIEKGMVEFTVNSPVNLPINRTAQVRVTTVGGSALASLAITFEGRRASESRPQANRAPTTSGTIDDVTFTLGEGSQSMTIDVLGRFSDADNDALTFSAFSSDTSVATVTVDANAGAITVAAVSVGEATITVRATDGNFGPATQTFTVTVEAMADTTLGAASGLTATAGDGQVTLSWTAGDNADIHWIAGITQADRAARNYGNMIWTQADGNDGHVVMGLTNGTAYDFAVLSGQVVDGTNMWGDTWSNVASATPAEASSGPANPFG